MLQVTLLGQFDVRLNGKPVDLSSQPAQVLLAYLLLHAGVALRREQLAGLLWPDSLDSSARKNLRNAIWLVRKAIGDQYLLADKTTVAFESAAPYELDAAILQRQAPEMDTAALIQAVSVYRGDLLPGYYEDWVQLERERLRGVFERRIQQLLDRLTAESQWNELQRWAEHWIALGHVPEPAYRALMVSHAVHSDLSRMASAYRRCVKSLQDELDVAPSAETQALYQRLLQGELPVQPQPQPVHTPERRQTPATPPDPRQRYITREILAVGGHGEVYLGEDQFTEKTVVIKRLKPELMTQNPDFVTRFVREGEILRQLNHPNVIQMLAAYEKGGEYYIVMEYAPGGTLRDLLEKTPQLPLAQALTIGLELADALSRAHHLNVIHRDIKPDNVLLADDGAPRLTDFGMARLVRENTNLTQPGAILGSPAYMSPEALRGESLDARSDIWAFGALLFEMMTGFHPFDEPRVATVLLKILNEPIPDIQTYCPDAPPMLVELVQQMMVKDRDGRISSMRQVAANLEAILDTLAAGQDGRQPIKTQTPIPGTPWSPGAAWPSGTPVPEPTCRHNLPAQSTPFVGRSQELADVRQMVEKDTFCRLLTLIGPGGSGKTRLSIQASLLMAEQGGTTFPDGVWFVPLASFSESEAIITAVASALEISLYDGRDSPRQQLLDALRNRRLLLLLDNFEHLLNPTSIELVSEILTEAPHVKLLTTSRMRLNVPGEQLYMVSGLEVPAVQDDLTAAEALAYSAIQLFQQHAHRAWPEFELTAENVTAVVHICRLAQGMPLAIELAAAWLKVLTTAEIAAEIEQSLDILETEWHDVPERQRSLRAVFNSSWQLLEASEQLALQGLATFQSGFTCQAAEAVTDISLKGILSLADKSWIQRLEDGRYQIHELLRQFAAQKLRADPAAWQRVREKQSVYYAAFLREQGSMMWGPRQREAFDAVASEFENVHLAWDWLVERRQLATVIDQMLPALFRFCELMVRSGDILTLLAVARQELEIHRELDEDGRLLTIVLIAQAAFSRHGYPIRFESFGMLLSAKEDILEDAWARAAALPSYGALGYWGALLAYLYGRMINREAGIARLHEVIAQRRRENARWQVAFALELLAHLRLRVYKEPAEQAETEAYFSEALTIFEALGDEREGGYTMRQLGQLRRFQHAYAEAIEHWQAAQARLNAVGDWPIATEIHWQIGDAYLQIGNFEAAFRHYRQMSDIYLARGYRREVAHILSKESYEALRYGEPEHARQTRQRCLDLARETGDGLAEAWSVWEMGEIYRVTGDYEAARRWYEDAQLLFEKVKEPAGYIFYHRGLGDLAYTLGDYTEAERQFQKSAACAAEANHTWGICYALIGLVRTATQQRRFDAAHTHLAELLSCVAPLDEQGILLATTAAAANLYAALGNLEYTLELCALVVNHHASWRETITQATLLLETAIVQMPADRAAAAQARGRRRDLWRTADELVNRLSASPRAIPNNLPTRLPPLVGRNKELAELDNLLAEANDRLLTLVGPGGIGKTRLALATAAAALRHFPHGVYFAPLAPLQSALYMVGALAESLDYHFHEANDHKQQLLDYLQSKKMLLILDNFEHVLEGAELVAAILQNAPQVTILVTSREKLNLSQETIYPVGGLDYPDWATPVEAPLKTDTAAYSAVQLLLQHVRQARPDFQPQPPDLHNAGRICRLTQGMPLAIELAAGWLGMLSLREIGDEIIQNLDFLETERRDIPARQRSVRAVFDASWKRLSASDQRVFMKLSTFRGGFTRQAAQSVAGADLKSLRTLVGKSFVATGRENRYEIHELLRQYGQECLETAGEAEQVRDAHMAYFLQALARREADIRGKDQPGALSEIETDFENIRAAWERAIRQSAVALLNGALETVHFFMDMRGRHQEGAELFRAAYSQLAAADSEAEMVKARLLLRYRFMQLMSTQQPGPEVADDLHSCLTIAQQQGQEIEVALCQSVLGFYKMVAEADPQAGLHFLGEAYDRFAAAKDDYFMGLALQWLSICHYQLGNREQFVAYTQQSVELARRHGSKVVQAYSQVNLAENALMMGEYQSVDTYLQETTPIAGQMKLPVLLIHSKLVLAMLHLFDGRAVAARPLLTEAFDLAGRLNYSITLAFACGVRALMDSIVGDYVSAQQAGEDSVSISANHGIGLMIAHLGLAMAYCGQQRPELAWRQVRMLMQQIQQEGFLAPQTWLLPITAVLLVGSGAGKRAVELLALADTHPLSPAGWLAHWPLLAEVRARLEQELGADSYQAAWERGKELDLAAVVAELLAAEEGADGLAVAAPASVPAVKQEIRFCISADNARLAYATVGSGPPLVKVANWLSHLEFDLNSPIWRHWIEGLSQQRALLRYDERGCGLSDWEVADFSVDAWVQDLEMVVNAAGLERFPLLGLSQGAAVAIAYAARHPQRVSHLVLCGGFARGFRKQPLSTEQLELTEAMIALVKSGWGRGNPAFRQLFTSLFIPKGTAEQMRWFNDLQRASTSPENAFHFMNAFYDLDVTELAAQVSAPTLVLHARRDNVIPFREGQEMAARIPNARFVSLESHNHILLEDEPAWQKFLAEFHRFTGRPSTV